MNLVAILNKFELQLGRLDKMEDCFGRRAKSSFSDSYNVNSMICVLF